jgi:hypothetical protein
MRCVLPILCSLLMLASGAWAQPDARPAHSQADSALTLADLEGASVEATVVMQRVVQRDGREFPARFQSDLKLKFGPGEKLDGILTSQATSPKGVRKGKPLAFSPKLEKPKEINVSGGGHSVWFFDQGTLTHLRTFKGGAYKRQIAFARPAGRLSCAIEETFAREAGVGSLQMNSPIDNAPMRVVSSKQVSSTCRVTERK